MSSTGSTTKPAEGSAIDSLAPTLAGSADASALLDRDADLDASAPTLARPPLLDADLDLSAPTLARPPLPSAKTSPDPRAPTVAAPRLSGPNAELDLSAPTLARPHQPSRHPDPDPASSPSVPPPEPAPTADPPRRPASRLAPQRPARQADPPRGALIGRYVVLDRLGAGGMGVVLAAYDPELDRKVALKLLLDARGGADTRARLVREAQALAQLAHPNVVAVHDVGTVDERVYVAMEFVAGQTLRAWLDRAPRTWRDVLRALLAAGDGLAAAHAAGLVHRDFKPDNVMVGDDGRVRVMDFGLARAAPGNDTPVAGAAASLAGAAAPVGALASLASALTQAGALMGTPQTMAPEQWERRETDARTDQFAFCVTLWEALHGAPPFAGDTVVARCNAVLRGQRRPPPPGVRIPAWLRRTLDRGLSLDPADRWPSMAALLTALRDDPTRRHRWALGGGAAALLAALALVGWRVERAQRVAACDAAAAAIDTAWGEPRREPTRAAMLATGAPFSEHVATTTIAHFDALARGWSAARRDTCLDATVTESVAADVTERREACLDDLRLEIGALVDALQAADRPLVAAIADPLAALRDPASCLDPTRLGPLEAVGPAERARARVIRELLARALVRHVAADLDAADALAAAARARADALGAPALRARARQLAGRIARDRGDYLKSRAALDEAHVLAGSGRADELAAEIALDLATTTGARLAHHDEGLTWIHVAEMWLDRLQLPARDPHRADALLTRGLVHLDRGDFAAADADLQASLALRPADAQGLAVAATHDAIGIVASERGDYARALAENTRALELRTALFGPAHPRVASSRNNLAVVLIDLGRDREAEVELRRALDARRAAFGDDHPVVSGNLTNLANVLERRGAYAEAVVLHRQALDISLRTYGPDHPNTAIVHSNLGRTLLYTRELAAAEEQLRRALAITEARYGPDHHEIAFALNGLGEVAQARRDYAAAAAHHRRALTVREAGLGPTHPYIAYSLTGLGEALTCARAVDEARPLLERALQIAPSAGDPELLARARVDLAAALRVHDPARAAALTAEAGPGAPAPPCP